MAKTNLKEEAKVCDNGYGLGVYHLDDMWKSGKDVKY